MVKQMSVTSHKGGDIGTTIYDGAAAYGYFMSYISLIVGNIIGIALVVLGLHLIFKKDKFSAKTTAVVKQEQCEKNTMSKDGAHTCFLELQYNASGSVVKKQYTTTDKIYNTGDEITIRYNPQNPQEITTALSARTLGWIFFSIGLFVLIGAWIYWYIIHTFKFAAAAAGLGSAMDIAR